MQQDHVVVVGADLVQGHVDVIQTGHAGGQDDRDVGARVLAHQRHVDQLGGADLEQLGVELQNLLQARLVPGRGEEDQSHRLTVLLELGHLVDVELKGVAVFAIGRAEGIGTAEAIVYQ